MPSTADSPGTVSYIRTLPENECFELLHGGHIVVESDSSNRPRSCRSSP